MTTTQQDAASADQAPRERRKLRFESIDEVFAEAERLAAAEREGRLTQLGKWPLGQTLGHLATWATFALEGYPPEIRAPLPIRLIGRLFRNYVLKNGMSPGMKVGKVPGGTLGIEPLTTDEGMKRLQTALSRLRATAPSIPNPIFGALTHEQWVQLNLRHAELHLGFLRDE